MKYFLAAAKYENISKAAQSLYVSQSAISRAIISLEQQYSVPLFERNGKNIKLNPSGLLLKDRAEEIMKLLHESENELTSFNNLSKKIIKLKLESGFGNMPETIKEFSRLHPDAGFHLLNSDSDVPYDILIRGNETPPDPDNSIVLVKEYLRVAIPTSCPLSNRKAVYLKEFEDFPFIALERGDGLRDKFDIICNSADFHPNIVYICSDYDYMQTMIRSGIAASLWPASATNNVTSPYTKVIDLYDTQQVFYITAHLNTYGSSTDISKTFFNYLKYNIQPST